MHSIGLSRWLGWFSFWLVSKHASILRLITVSMRNRGLTIRMGICGWLLLILRGTWTYFRLIIGLDGSCMHCIGRSRRLPLSGMVIIHLITLLRCFCAILSCWRRFLSLSHLPTGFWILLMSYRRMTYRDRLNSHRSILLRELMRRKRRLQKR